MTLNPSNSGKRARFPIGLTVTVAICVAIQVGLGLWQMQRMAWKQNLLGRVEALKAAPAIAAGPALALGGDLDYRRVELDCAGLATAHYVEMHAVRDGDAGSRLISACAVQAGPYRSVLVDRGFVADTISARPPVVASTAPLHVVGVLRSSERRSFVAAPDDVARGRFYTRDAGLMAKALGAAAPAPLFLNAETPTNPEWPALIPAPLPTDIPNNHLQYALTWFGLAVALVGVYAAMLLRWLKTR